MVEDGYNGKLVITEVDINTKYGCRFNKALVLAYTEEGSEETDYTIIAPDNETALYVFRQVTGFVGRLDLDNDLYVMCNDDSPYQEGIVQLVTEETSGYTAGSSLIMASMYATHAQLRQIFDVLAEKYA